jgi:myo-inositol-1(or 4)-monophosphatase
MNNFPASVEIMYKACRKAAQFIARDLIEIEKLQVSQKGISNFVTGTDLKVEKIIFEELHKARPTYNMLLEESGFIEGEVQSRHGKMHTDDDEYTWIVDPIDGTSNFIHGNPNFSISIALQKRNKSKQRTTGKLSLFGVNEPDYLGIGDMIAGMVYIPVTEEIYWAEKGTGAYYIDNCEKENRLKISSRTNFEELLFSTIATRTPAQRYSKIHELLTTQYAKQRISGSVALDLALLAAGKLDVALYNEVMLWDIAAGALIAQESGAGYYELYKTKNVLREAPCVKGLLVGNRKIIDRLLSEESEITQ